MHGEAATQSAIDASGALFGQGDLALLDETTLLSATAELPSATLESSATIAQALVETGLVASLGAARRAASEGGVYANNARIASADQTLAESGPLHGVVVVRRGKKTLAGVTISA